jgi:hypothetical protein
VASADCFVNQHNNTQQMQWIIKRELKKMHLIRINLEKLTNKSNLMTIPNQLLYVSIKFIQISPPSPLCYAQKISNVASTQKILLTATISTIGRTQDRLPNKTMR